MFVLAPLPGLLLYSTSEDSEFALANGWNHRLVSTEGVMNFLFAGSIQTAKQMNKQTSRKIETEQEVFEMVFWNLDAS